MTKTEKEKLFSVIGIAKSKLFRLKNSIEDINADLKILEVALQNTESEDIKND